MDRCVGDIINQEKILVENLLKNFINEEKKLIENIISRKPFGWRRPSPEDIKKYEHEHPIKTFKIVLNILNYKHFILNKSY